MGYTGCKKQRTIFIIIYRLRCNSLAGGLAAVVFTDTFQTVVMLGGAVFLASMGKLIGLGIL